ncbi:MAG: winged helix-turn-helix domain-containing protein [Ktedonobacterales bacterium]|jgi:transposase
MPRPLKIAVHLSVTELEASYRRATDPVARSQWQMLWLLAGGQSTAQVAASTGYSCDWIRTIAHRYQEAGPAGVGDRRHHNRGAKRLLTAAQEAELDQALDGPAPRGGRWTAAQAAAWMSERVGRPVHVARGWEAMRRLGFTLGRPRPRHANADLAVQEAFKKGGSPSR